MGVKYYEWGVTSGGSDSGGGTVPADASYGPVEDFTGTLTGAVATITFSADTKSVHILNTHAANDLLVSFDGGTDWVTVASYGDIEEAAAVSSIMLNGVAGTTYHVIAITQG